jgi:4-hydroxy-4-methyl-2-oxoglutarate aldolase
VGRAYTIQGGALPDIGWEAGVERMRSYLEMFERLTPDSVLVHSNDPQSRVGHFGELTANAAKARGCVGVILDGNVRDVEGLRAIGFQVFYRDLSPLSGIGRWEMIASEEPVTIGDVVVRLGDIVFGEFDGVLVIPGAEAERVLLVAEKIAAAEAKVRAEMRAGGAPIDSLERHGHI